MARLPEKCDECMRRSNTRCRVFEDEVKAWAMPNGCSAFCTDKAALKALEAERRAYIASVGGSLQNAREKAIV